MNGDFNHRLRGPSGPFNYNTIKVDFEFFVYFIGPVVSIIAIMAAVILVHPEWVKRPKLAHADRSEISVRSSPPAVELVVKK